jgi:hypothetical protein
VEIVSPPTPGPDEPPPLSAHEREILAGIEQDLDTNSPALARAMAQPLTSTVPLPRRMVHAGYLAAALFLVLAVTGLVPAVVWALLAALAAMVVIPWVMLRAFERLDPGRNTDRDPGHNTDR